MNTGDIKSQIIKNSFWNFLSSLINRIGGFFLIIFISRLLMPEGFGKYSLAMTISLFFITFSDMGINQTLIRYVSLGIDNKNNSQSAAYFNYLFRLKFIITLFVSLILFLISYPLANYIFKDPSLFHSLIILSFYVFFISLTGFFESLFFIKKNVKYISLKESLSFLIKIGGIFVIWYFVKPEFRMMGIFVSFLIVSFLTLFFVFCFSRKAHPSLFKRTKCLINKKTLTNFILFINIQNISLIILSQATIIILGIFLTEEYVGYYNSSWALVAGISSLLLSSFSYILLPIFTNVEEEKFQHILKKTFKIFFILTLPISFGLSILSRFFISTIYGHEYILAYNSLRILSFVIPCMIGTELSLVSFSARGNLKRFSMQMLISVAIFFILNYLSILIFFNISEKSVLIGISIANLISWITCFLSSILLLKKELNVKIFSFWIIKPLLSCLIMSSLIIFLLTIFKDVNLFLGIVMILTGAFIYFASLWIMKGIEISDFSEIPKILFKLNK